jgi:hypothetical protein
VGVPEVHAVEVPDADHGPAEVGRHVVDVSPDLHGSRVLTAGSGVPPGAEPDQYSKSTKSRA